MLLLPASVAVTVCVPAVLSVPMKMCAPTSPEANEKTDGANWPSLLLNVTVDNFFLASVNRGYGVRRNSPGERKTITPSEKRISYTPAPRETISQLPIRTKFIPLQPSCEKLALAQSRGWARNSQFLRRC